VIVVIQCAASKRKNAGFLKTKDGMPVSFVAHPELAPAAVSCVYARPDDTSDAGGTWRDQLLAYNASPGTNPLGLLPAFELYENDIYRALVKQFGVQNTYILSAGWGLIDAAFLTPLAGFAAANELVGKSDVEVREAIGDKFPKHIYHSIVCIGALIAHREPDHWAVDAVGAPHVGERTEKELITAFCDKIAELSPQLVTFNGNSFDLPVLRYRAMAHGVSALGLSARPYFHRYRGVGGN
jgi:hypothetical protein